MEAIDAAGTAPALEVDEEEQEDEDEGGLAVELATTAGEESVAVGIIGDVSMLGLPLTLMAKVGTLRVEPAEAERPTTRRTVGHRYHWYRSGQGPAVAWEGLPMGGGGQVVASALTSSPRITTCIAPST